VTGKRATNDLHPVADGGLGEVGAGLPVAPIARANREEFLCRDHDLLC
jgi:hypothetical protein